ncbi:hypothetical protein [Luteimonas abyssi]|uniref:hypothetical protein n=1 Tax=Luteimonas abyssi TaxID=1247514 RepID=UPI000737CBA6|nr:hypothetical protein [Luteimonas abyssi]
MQAPALYLVYLEPEPPAEVGAALRPLAPGLYLTHSAQTRSRLYHELKRRCRPRRLLVAPLADAPKFKGMQSGALAWLRAREG